MVISFEKIKATDILKETLAIITHERELFLLLGGLIGVFTFLFAWLDIEDTILMLQEYSNQDLTDPISIEEQMQRMSQMLWDFIIFMPVFFVQYGIMALWSRAAILGKYNTLEGGLNMVFKRSIWVFWRLICSFGWIIIIGIVATIIMMIWLFGMIGIGLTPEGNLSIFIAIILPMSLFIFVMIGLIFLLSVSIHCEVRDLHMPIKKAFKILKGNQFRATTTVSIFLVSLFFISYFGNNWVFENYYTTPAWLSASGLFISTFIASLINLGSMTFGAIYASRLVPELRV